MDLKSMLNDSAPNRPSLPSSHSTLAQHNHVSGRSDSNVPPHEQLVRDRAVPYPPSLQPVDQKPSAGSYFGQSPYQSSALSSSTWSAGPPSANSQSPGSLPLAQTPRDGYRQTSDNHNMSPISAAHSHHPPTPGPFSHPQSYPQPSPQNQTPLTPSSYPQAPIKETGHGANGVFVGPSHPSAAIPPGYSHSANPLGPAPQFQKPSPPAQRPSSQGFEHYRTYSAGSIGSSSHGRDMIPSHFTSPQQFRREGLHRQYSVDRERSISVSPKTIPRPSPFRQPTGDSRRQSVVTPIYHSKAEADEAGSSNIVSADQHSEAPQPALTPQSMSQTSKETRLTPQTASPGPSPRFATNQIPASQSPQMSQQHSLKRNASLASSISTATQPARKRLKRDEIPIYAQSARPIDRPIRLNRGQPLSAKFNNGSRGSHYSESSRPVNGPAPTLQLPPQPSQVAAPAEPKWEPSITNVVPYEDLTRQVCNWIFQHIATDDLLAAGAKFEIEAKIGEIREIERDERVRLPVDTEAIFNKERWRPTKFQSSMNMTQHRQLNEFLNHTVEESHREALNSDREPIYTSHPHEFDEFFELKPIGIANLPPSISQFMNNRKHKPRVRKTFDLNKNAAKEQIIKSRIADLDIYNPGADFDYRISINMESPWSGSAEWLEPLDGGGKERSKDRMSYRHLAYQIDLTQVSHSDGRPKEHELEVEVSEPTLRRELENLRMNQPSKYESVVRGFLDNVRILCRKGTVSK